tara:strand:+ start:1023 stop:1415 length:393 start_codon:yes stop_codon:yes gene_type:complete
MKNKTRIDNSFRNMCIVSDVKLGFSLGDITAKGWPNVVNALSDRVETDSLGNILKIDGKKIHLFPWCANFKLEGTEDFERIKNGLTDEYSEQYYGKASWKTMIEQEPHIWLQTDEEKKEVVDYWKNIKNN